MTIPAKNSSLKPYLFNRKAHFGTYKSQGNNTNNGQTLSPAFAERYCLWCAPITRTMNQRFQLQGTKLEDTITIAVHHTKSLTNDKNIVVKYNDMDYKIVDISSDDSNNVITYDYLTMEAMPNDSR